MSLPKIEAWAPSFLGKSRVGSHVSLLALESVDRFDGT